MAIDDRAFLEDLRKKGRVEAIGVGGRSGQGGEGQEDRKKIRYRATTAITGENLGIVEFDFELEDDEWIEEDLA
jgi:hypothetical protein